MAKNSFKTRLEIAKKKAFKRELFNKKDNPSPIGVAFKLSTELVSAVVVGTSPQLQQKLVQYLA